MSTATNATPRRWSLGVLAARRRATTLWLDQVARLARLTARPRAYVRPVTEVVTPLAWTALVGAVVAMVAGAWVEWNELLVAGWFVLALLALSVAFVFGRHSLDAGLDLSRDRVVVGERANGRLLITNTTGHRALPLTIELAVGHGRAAFDLPGLKAHGEHEELFAIPTARRAVIDVGPVRAVRSDPLGLLRREQQLSGVELLHVHPRTVRIEGSAQGILRDLEGDTARKITDHDVAFHALRAYVPGDDRRYIHWKSSARSGTLMVRQFEETRRSHLLCLLSTRLDDYASDAEFETAVSVVGSMGVQTLVDGQTLGAMTSTRRLRHATATTLLDELSGVEFERNAPGMVEATRRAGKDNHGASIVLLVGGSLVGPSELRQARRHLPPDVRTIAVTVRDGAEASVRSMGDLHLVTLGGIDDLAATLRRLAQ